MCYTVCVIIVCVLGGGSVCYMAYVIQFVPGRVCVLGGFCVLYGLCDKVCACVLYGLCDIVCAWKGLCVGEFLL